jgi:dTDP-4-amino-4,6-dideoxygalactose transaminase
VLCSWHIYPVLLASAAHRDPLADQLRGAGVQTSVHYAPLHLTRAFAAFGDTPLPNTESYASRTLTLPLFPHMSPVQERLVIASIKTCSP